MQWRYSSFQDENNKDQNIMTIKSEFTELYDMLAIIYCISVLWRASLLQDIEQRRGEGVNVRSVTENWVFLFEIGLLIVNTL